LRDVLIILGAVAAALAALAGVVVSTDVTKRQNDLAASGRPVGEALAAAKRSVMWRRLWIVVPGLLAVAINGAALLTGAEKDRFGDKSQIKATDCLAFYVQLDQLADDEPSGLVQRAVSKDPRLAECGPLNIGEFVERRRPVRR
jgi:hypothetical protein